MWLAWIPVVAMTMGLIVYVRGLNLIAGTRNGTIARFEAAHATASGMLLTILTYPWLILTAVLIP